MAKKIKSFSSTSFLLIGHYATFAEADMMVDYLITHKAKTITRIDLPLPELPYMEKTHITVINKGKQKHIRNMRSFVKPPLLAYTLQSFQLLYIVFSSKQKYDIVIAQDSLLAFFGIIFRSIGKCKRVIFFSHGIDKVRFKNPFFNKLYRILETFSARNSDFNWFMSKNMIPIRKKQKIKEENMFWIPSTVPIKTVARKSRNNDKSSNVVFLGTIDEKNGAELLTKIIFQVKKSIPDVKLDVMGDGALFKKVSEDIKKKDLSQNIAMLGHLKFKEFSEKLTDYAIGIAPYAYSETNLTPLSDSLKMRLYLAAGLSVVITRGFSFSDEIKEHKLGFAVEQTVPNFAKAIVTLLKDKKMSQEIRTRALQYSKELDLTGFYDRAFRKVLRTL